MSKTKLSVLGVAVALVLFFAVNLASGAIFTSTRVDLTENKLYTLSEGTKNVLRGLEEPVTLRFYYSEALAEETKNLAQITEYARRVKEMLQEYESYAGGKLDLYVIEPEPFSEEEDRAVGFGLKGLALTAGGDLLYFGLAGTNTTDQEEVIPFFHPARQEFLEYDLTRLIYSLGYESETVVGLLSSLPIQGGGFNPMNPSAPPAEAWVLNDYLRELSDVREIATTDTEIPEEIEVLVLVHPKQLSQDLLYSIDQFVLRGGKLVAFLDPHCEADPVPRDPNNPLAGMQADRSSYLSPLLGAWGVEMVRDKVVGDLQNALKVGTGNGGSSDYVVFIGLGEEAFDGTDPVAAELDLVRMGSAGALRPIEGASTRFSPLIRTSEDSMLVDRMSVALMPDPDRLLKEFVPSGERLVVAARVSGAAKSAFPDGDPSPDEDDPEAAGDEDGEPESEDSASAQPTHLAESQGDINVLVVADADMLADQWWVRPFNLLGTRYFQPTADNGDLVVNAIENMSGSSDLISLRSRPSFERPFSVVADIRRDAEERYREQEQALEAKLQDIEKRINDLQAQKGDGVGAMILSPEQREQLELAREEQLNTRKKLREVKHSLQREIESLGTWLKLGNILIVPMIVAALALAGGFLRSRRSRD